MKMIEIDDTKISVKDFSKWIRALRSGKFQQTRGT
jgi:hypothetical protein